MSTKTTFKRIALVAVASLGFGVLTSVAPANAALATTVAVVTNTSGTVYGTVGTAATATIQLATTTPETGGSAGDSFTLVPTIVSQPVGGGLTVGAPASGTVGLTSPAVTGNMAATATQNKWTSTVSAGIQTLAYSTGTIPAQTATDVSTLSLTATVAGTYTVTVTPTGTLAAPNTKTPVTVTFQIAGLAYSLGDGAAASPATTGNGIAGPANTVTVNATTNASNTRSLVTVSGAGATINSNAGTALTAGATSTIVAAGTNAAIIINTPNVGTITVSQFYESGNGTGIYASTASKTVVININAAAVSGAVSATTSTSYLNIGSGTAGSAASINETVVASQTAGTQAANIVTTLAAGIGSVASTQAISVVVNGPGYVILGTSPVSGRNISTTYSAVGSGAFTTQVWPDGTAGVTTITITAGAFTTTKTVTFYGAIAKLTATVKKKAIVPGATTSNVVALVATDSAGVVVPSVPLTATSSDTTKVATTTATSETSAAAAAGTATTGVTTLASTKGVVTITYSDTATGLVTTTVSLTIGSLTASTVTLSLDKTEYAPGEKATLTLTAKDADGNPVADQTNATMLSGALATSTGLTSTLFTNGSVTLSGGVATQTFYAPIISGPLTISGTLGTNNVATSAQGTAISATTTVLSDGVAQAAVDAAAEATDAANAATDAANAAAEAADAATAAAQDAADAVAALSTQVSEMINALKKQITALTNLVIKIQKKVKA